MQQSSTIRVGIIGLGVIGENVLNAFLKLTDIKVVAICDVIEDRVKTISEQINGVAWYTNHMELTKRPDIDLIYVAVPPKYHHQIALDVIAAGKHIFCEKPLANSLIEAREMAEHAKQAGVIHAMNFPVYYKNVFKEIQNRLSSGSIGEVRRVEIMTHFHQWPREWQQTDWIGGREQGGFVREVLPHYIQLTQALFGKMDRIESQLEYPDDPTKCETGIIATMKLANGNSVLINGLSQIGQEEQIQFVIYGSKGTIALVNWGRLEVGKYNELSAEITVEPNDSTQDLITNLVRAINGKDADLVDFEAGYEVQRVLEALLQKESYVNECVNRA
ncbi:Gfo/Idh/MocA family oxidoreductase [Paenibacillus sp. N1-5-1-14]|uniref:Gfo/Idh/MocA family protein n=1 Tax=Paenibacillus radicibacter TaxID=2972488 RepID=UPI0021592C72|nr:Gfo/Idh/MocA family oxidoreductase [Paenibacillus radicibacter]MCR8644228.1 Gfo/Idh/MocA family oxidoreductase [Paenibacillus radicibacter]